MTETIDLADLASFLAIAREGGITRAADKLGVRKAAVSRSLQRLEHTLGVKLFERSTRRLAITPAGRVLQGRAESLLSDVDDLRTELRRDERETGGTLTIAAPPELGIALTESVIAPFAALNPRLRVHLRLDYAFHDMFDPEIDLALRVGEVRDDSLVPHPLWTFRRIAVASPDARETPSSPADLARISCLAFDERSFASTWTFTDTRASCTVHVEGRFGARSYPALIAAASAGLGVALVPEFVAASHVQAARLRRVLPRWASPPMTIYAVHRVGQSRVRRVATFVEYLRALRVLPAGLETITAIPRRRSKA